MAGARKYGAPLFACGFAAGEGEAAGSPPGPGGGGGLVAGAGGGGAGSTGVANRVLLLGFRGPEGELAADPLAEAGTGKVAPARGAAPRGGPAPRPFAVALAGGDLRSFHPARAAPAGPGRAGREAAASWALAAAPAGQAASLGAEVKALGFAPAAAGGGASPLLAAGTEGGEIAVLAWPALGAPRARLALPKGAGDPASVALGPLPDGPREGAAGWRLLAVVGQRGRLWAFLLSPDGRRAAPLLPAGEGEREGEGEGEGPRAPQAVAAPAALGEGQLRGGAFGRGEELFTAFNPAGKQGRPVLLRWDLRGGGPPRRSGAAHRAGRVCALAAWGVPGAPRSLVATGSTEGEVCLFDGERLAPLRRVPGAHMIFVTELAFSEDGRWAVSVSADAGARCHAVPEGPAGGGLLAGLPLFLLVVLLLLAAALALGGAGGQEEARALGAALLTALGLAPPGGAPAAAPAHSGGEL